MLDVHVPEGGMHGIKDFLLHIFTITIGLLIALGLEGCVEKIHQHHIRDEADSNIRQEIRHNEDELKTTLDAAVIEQKNLVEVLKFLQAKSESKPYPIDNINLSFTTGNVSDANWRTATATGALGFIEYKHVEQLASAYQVQEIYMRLEQQTLDGFLDLQSYVLFGFDPDKLSPEAAKAATPEVRRTLSHVVALQQVGSGLHHAYEDALAVKLTLASARQFNIFQSCDDLRAAITAKCQEIFVAGYQNVRVGQRRTFQEHIVLRVAVDVDIV